MVAMLCPVPFLRKTSLISFRGANTGTGGTVTIPSHQAGDLIFIFAVNTAENNVAPTAPGGWTNVVADTSVLDFKIAYKIAASSSETSGSWSNAEQMNTSVYRGVNASPIGANASGSNGSSSTITYPAQTLTASGTSWMVLFGGNQVGSSTIESPPTGTVLRAHSSAAGPESAIFDTNGPVSSWSSQGVSLGTSRPWQSFVVELKSA